MPIKDSPKVAPPNADDPLRDRFGPKGLWRTQRLRGNYYSAGDEIKHRRTGEIRRCIFFFERKNQVWFSWVGPHAYDFSKPWGEQEAMLLEFEPVEHEVH